MKKIDPIPEQYFLIHENLRLRPFSLDDVAVALPWYQDLEVLKYTGGIDSRTPYDLEMVKKMYAYLTNIGECYIIEIKEGGDWLPIGDVTLSEATIPIVIGRKDYWGRGIGKQVLIYLIGRARDLGYSQIKVKEIYNFNERSIRLFRSLGFTETGKTEQGIEMVLRF